MDVKNEVCFQRGEDRVVLATRYIRSDWDGSSPRVLLLGPWLDQVRLVRFAYFEDGATDRAIARTLWMPPPGLARMVQKLIGVENLSP